MRRSLRPPDAWCVDTAITWSAFVEVLTIGAWRAATHIDRRTGHERARRRRTCADR